MHVSKITVSKTEPKENGSYFKFGLEVDVYPGESYEDAKKEALAEVDKMVGTSSAPIKPKTEAKTEAKEEKAAEEKPTRRTRRTAPAAKKEEKKEEAPKKEEKKEEAPKKEEGEKPAKRTRRAPAKKNTAYDRENKAHKVQFAALADEHFPGWKKDPELAKSVKAASVELNGSDMLDADGNAMDAFTDQMIQLIEGEDAGV